MEIMYSLEMKYAVLQEDVISGNITSQMILTEDRTYGQPILMFVNFEHARFIIKLPLNKKLARQTYHWLLMSFCAAFDLKGRDALLEKVKENAETVEKLPSAEKVKGVIMDKTGAKSDA